MYLEYIPHRMLLSNEMNDILQDLRFFVLNDVTNDAASQFIKTLIAAQRIGQPFLPVHIDSEGGNTYAMLQMIDYIRNSPIPIATIVTGIACSAGADILAAGTKGWRFAAPYSTIMIHECSDKLHSNKLTDLKAGLDEAKRVDGLAFNLLNEHCNKPIGYFEEQLKKRQRIDWTLTAGQALEQGLVDHVGIPSIKVNVSVDMKLETN